MKLLASKILLTVYLILMVRPAIPVAADFVAHTLWAHHHYHTHHHGKHGHLQKDLSNAVDEDHQNDHQQFNVYKTELYFAPEHIEYHFITANTSAKQQFFFHPLKCQAKPAATSPPPES